LTTNTLFDTIKKKKKKGFAKMLLGYARISTKGQKLDRQIDMLKDAGVKEDNIYQEEYTGTKKDRPELKKLMNSLRENDTLVVTSLSRLSRSTKHLIELVEQIHDKGADIKSIKEEWLDTTTSQGKLFFKIMASLNEFERDLISDRTKEGLKAARARGREGGRPKLDKDKVKTALTMYDSQDFTISEITEQTGVSKASLYRYLKKREKKNSKN